ncbi:tRNA1(Val) (adenine(37)-N6)-methyltransferase [Aureimonas pseudogalii]|uniref:tRNA1(Val) A37 N6-methylase TrmN6 n=1 Tax=Aureimonas pseudogalii TaxID=1744844 RepID=A0A7W6E8Y2_9HYPH|nr:methyltransferase [Aureimonas pseudogalii]MBB3996444.1 tRNA1(Val) A37 N6-methylase TrmN6 [Aureimonas pseudogalii]
MNSPTRSEPAASLEGTPAVSRDAFQRGAFELLQPAGRGFRAGHDALLLASCVGLGATGRVLDMGAGNGAVAFAAAMRSPDLRIDLAERNGEIAALAEGALMLPANRGFAPRLRVLRLDCLAPRGTREAAGLLDGAYDLVLTNPPFHPAGQRGSPDALRDEARAIPDAAFLGRWLAVAAALLRHGGRLALIARPDNLGDLLAAAEGRLGALRVRAVHPSPEAPANRILLGAIRGSRQPLRLLPPLVLDAMLRAAVSDGLHHTGGILGD